MKDKYFLDTNVFIYAFDHSSPEKRQKANHMIKTALVEKRGCISYQVIQEFFNVAMRKFQTPLSIPDSQRYLNAVLAPLCQVFASIELYRDGLNITQKFRYSF